MFTPNFKNTTFANPGNCTAKPKIVPAHGELSDSVAGAQNAEPVSGVHEPDRLRGDNKEIRRAGCGAERRDRAAAQNLRRHRGRDLHRAAGAVPENVHAEPAVGSAGQRADEGEPAGVREPPGEPVCNARSGAGFHLQPKPRQHSAALHQDRRQR